MDYNVESLHKEIDLIQGCVNRMAQNSFMLKGWLISLIAVVIVLFPKDVDINPQILLLLLFGIICCFWYLDGFFLNLEKLYRMKYMWVISERPKGNLNFLYDLNPYNKNMWLNPNSKKCKTINGIISITLIVFYGMILLVSIGIVLIKISC